MATKPEIYEEHSELFHYTNRKGLVGILKSQNLRATHYRFLNDSTEVQLMRLELIERLMPFIEEQMIKTSREAGPKMERAIRERGGVKAIAHHDTKLLVDTFYDVAFQDSSPIGGLTIPYVTSFCAHTSDNQYVQKNGLLSQWRGYGKGGYAIVFDTRKLLDLYRLENINYYYSFSILADIVYQGDDEKFEEEFNDSIEKIKHQFIKYFETAKWEIGEIFGDAVSMFTRLKHLGFSEEREVRYSTLR